MSRTPRACGFVVAALALLGAHALMSGCGIELEAGPSADASAPDGALPGRDAGTDAASGPGCDFALEPDTFSTLEACSSEYSQCGGSAVLAEDARTIVLTSTEPSDTDPRIGAFWRRVDLPVARSFTLTADVSTHQPPGGLIGYGFAIVLLQAKPGTAGFPVLESADPSGMGINETKEFQGAAAVVKNYNGKGDGVFALATVPVPYNKELLGGVSRTNDETFTRDEPTYQRLVIQSDGASVSVELSRFAGPDFSAGVPLETKVLELSSDATALTHIDFVGVIGSRGNNAYSQSAHHLEAISLACSPP